MGASQTKSMIDGLQCPHKTGCSWNDHEILLGPHYQQKHPENCIGNPAVLHLEKQTVANEYLLVHKDKHFIVNVEQKKFNDHVWKTVVSVQFVGNQSCAENFEYSVNMKHVHDDGVIVKKFSGKRIYGSCTIKKDCTEIYWFFLGPHIQLYTGLWPVSYDSVEISPQYFIDIKCKQQSTTALETNRTILRTLECPSCLEVMSSPIYQCQNGHLICDKCTTQLNSCPTCNCSPNSWNRSLFAESVADEMFVPCTYAALGCQHVCPIKDLQSHEDDCHFGLFDCPVKPEECMWKGLVHEVLMHVKGTHEDHVLENENLEVVIPCEQNELQEQDNDCFVFKCIDNIFRLLYKYENSTFSWAVQLIGPSVDYDRFKYVLTVVSPEDEILSFKMSQRCLPYAEINCIKQWISFPRDVDMLDANKNLTYNIKIVKK